MADAFLGIARGQIDGDGSQMTVAATSAGTAVDFEFRMRGVPAVSSGSAGGSSTIEALNALEQFKHYLENHGLESLPGQFQPDL